MRPASRFALCCILLSCALALNPPWVGLAQSPHGSSDQSGDQVEFLLVLVDQHEFAGFDGVVQTFGESADELPHLHNLVAVLILADVASPDAIHSAARVVLALRDEGSLHGPSDRAIPFSELPPGDQSSDWAIQAWELVRSARAVPLPGISDEPLRTTSVGVAPRLLEDPEAGKRTGGG